MGQSMGFCSYCSGKQDNKLSIEKASAYPLLKKIEFIEEIEIDDGKSIPFINGIDIHPTKNLYLAATADGDTFIKSFDLPGEIFRFRTTIEDSSNLDTILWSIDGEKVLRVKSYPATIEVYSIKKGLESHLYNLGSHKAYGAIWLSQRKIAIGFGNGVLKIFNIVEDKEIGKLFLQGSVILGMDKIGYSKLVVGDSGILFCISWKKNIIDWKIKKISAIGNIFTVIKTSRSKKKILTGSDDSFVKCYSVSTKSILWDHKMNTSICGLAWVPGDAYVVALSNLNQLIFFDSLTGTVLYQYESDLSICHSFRLHDKNREILIGNDKGMVKRFKIVDKEL